MAQSTEHYFISCKLDEILKKYGATKLIGVLESDRKRFDYSCIMNRDYTRSLVSQVLWSHTEGIDKDIRTLLHEPEAMIKVYFVRDSIKHRLRIDEVITDYRRSDGLKSMLSGLKIIFLPEDFDADKEEEQNFIVEYLSKVICEDLLFGIVFGNLSQFDIDIFAEHTGPNGLKFAILDEITKNGLIHTPSFKKRLGYSTDGTIKVATTMLAATGLVKRVPRSVVLLPTLKGRMLLDLTRRLLYEKRINPDNTKDLVYSGETLKIIKYLMPTSSSIIKEQPLQKNQKWDTLTEILQSAEFCHSYFGRDLLEDINLQEPRFYSTYNWQSFYEKIKRIPDIRSDIFSDPDTLFFVNNG